MDSDWKLPFTQLDDARAALTITFLKRQLKRSRKKWNVQLCEQNLVDILYKLCRDQINKNCRRETDSFGERKVLAQCKQ